jgi:glutathione S-transferase
MILYHGEPTGASLAVLAALGESGLDIECRRIDLLAGERHVLAGIDEPLARDMSVEGEGPVLVVTDAAGRAEAMTESVFIAQFLDECGAGSLQPADAYAHWQTLMWCRRITERCAPAAAFLGNRAYATPRLAAMDEAAFEATIAPIVSEDLQQRWRDTRADAFPAELGADSRAKVTQAAEQVEAQLADGREWLMGPLTIADFETYGWLAGMAGLLADAFVGKPRLAAWLQRVRQRPSVQAALARAGVAAPEQSWAPGPEINRWG